MRVASDLGFEHITHVGLHYSADGSERGSRTHLKGEGGAIKRRSSLGESCHIIEKELSAMWPGEYEKRQSNLTNSPSLLSTGELITVGRWKKILDLTRIPQRNNLQQTWQKVNVPSPKIATAVNVRNCPVPFAPIFARFDSLSNQTLGE